MIPLLQQSLVQERHALSIDQLLYAFTVARVTPGQANVYVASIGYMLFGVPGAVLPMLAIMAPAYLILPLLLGYQRIRAARAVQGVTRGLVAASAGLILAAAVTIGRETLTHPAAWGSFAVALVLAAVVRWNSVLSLVVASLAGLALWLWL
jgi:chromate transporter